MKNLHKSYYKDYFNKVTFSLNPQGELQVKGAPNDIVKENIVKESEFYKKISEDWEQELSIERVIFEVQYPGLITGVGIQHGVGAKGEYMLGMHFDYTYGLPIVYGSSVKGVLKSYFKECYDGEKNPDELVADIFESKYYETDALKPLHERDLFFDAVISQPNESGQILDKDTLAPHGGKKHDDPFAEPVPIPFIKIASGVQLAFRFRLKETKDKTGKVVMSKYDKKNLFKQILEKYGVGAKTNVGYGLLKYVEGI